MRREMSHGYALDPCLQPQITLSFVVSSQEENGGAFEILPPGLYHQFGSNQLIFEKKKKIIH